MLLTADSLLSRIVNRTTAACRSSDKPVSHKVRVLTAEIISNVRFGRLSRAVSILFASPVGFEFSLYDQLFRICASKQAIVESRKLESHLISFYPDPPIFLLNRAIVTYGKCKCAADAKELFDEMPRRDGGSWNAIITVLSQSGHPRKALQLFSQMHKSGISPTEVTFASVLSSCASDLALWPSRQVHGLVVKYGCTGNVVLESSLVDAYGKCHVMHDARRMFDEIQYPNAISWNVIVRRHLEMGEGKKAVEFFCNMIRRDATPLTFTISNALKACSSFCGLNEGAQIHGFAVKVNFEDVDVVSRSLIDMYGKCGELESAHRIFDQFDGRCLIDYTSLVSSYAMKGQTREAREIFNEMLERNVVAWNAMLTGYVHSSQWDDALDFIVSMTKETKLDYVSLSLILNVSAGLLDVQLGKQVHGYIYRHGFYSSVCVGNALLNMYGKCGSLKSAEAWFNNTSHWWDSVSWNTLLTSYTQHQRSEEAISIFWKMLGDTKPSKYTFGTLLAACANTFCLDSGKQIHGFMIRNGYDIDVVIRGALVDMYNKCHYAEYAVKVFEEAPNRDLVMLNSLMLGCCHNGKWNKVFAVFAWMEREAVQPDNITFNALLRACIFEGHLKLGRQYFDLMSEKYYVLPRLEHYEAIIELYGRHGTLDQLEDFIEKMPFRPSGPLLEKVLEFHEKLQAEQARRTSY